MKKNLIVLLLSLLALANCQSPLFTVVSLANDTEQHISGNNGSVGITSAKVVKRGESCNQIFYYYLLYNLYYSGHVVSVEEAKANGGITKVATIDYTTESSMPMFKKECIVVWGE